MKSKANAGKKASARPKTGSQKMPKGKVVSKKVLEEEDDEDWEADLEARLQSKNAKKSSPDDVEDLNLDEDIFDIDNLLDDDDYYEDDLLDFY